MYIQLSAIVYLYAIWPAMAMTDPMMINAKQDAKVYIFKTQRVGSPSARQIIVIFRTVKTIL